MDASEASRTAILVCQGRAFADGRIATDRFSDPVAAQLLRPDELKPVTSAGEGTKTGDWRSRMSYEMMRASAEVMVPRTVAIDDAVREKPASQVVNLGAGLDGRAWRMTELASSVVFEVDHPASQADKRERLGGLHPTAMEVRFVPVDLTHESLDARLQEAGHQRGEPTTWIWEGVIPYLTSVEVSATLRALAGRSAPTSRLIVNYQAPSITAAAGRLFARAMSLLTSQRDMLWHEPWRSAWRPDEMGRLLSGAGFQPIRDVDLLTVSEGLGLEIQQSRSVSFGRVCVADQ